MAKDFSTAPQPPTPPETPERVCRIALTPAQQAAVEAHSGRRMDYVDVADDDGSFSAEMGARHPDEITQIALRRAAALNDWDEAYRAYLVELAAWQDAPDEPGPMDALAEKTAQDAEAMQAALAAFYGAETEALEAARAEAMAAFDPKGKKGKGQAQEDDDA